jgi:DNA-directed RNA polymerase specialized sigma24 family protein
MQTLCEDELTYVSHADLLARCRTEMARYRRAEPHDDRTAVELFRRAIAERDDRAWEALRPLYERHVTEWCRRAGAVPADLDESVQATWVKFWQHYTPVKLQSAAGLRDVLAYLKLCARSVVLDTARHRGSACRLGDGPEPADTRPSSADRQVEAEERDAFWRQLETLMRSERERVLVALIYGLGLRSAEVQARRPDLFPTVGEVYRTTRNVLDRLRRSLALREWRRATTCPESGEDIRLCQEGHSWGRSSSYGGG